jgi:hypothetical protein
VGELSVGAVDVAPLVVKRHNRRHLVGQQAVERVATGGPVLQLAGGPAPHPPISPVLGQLQLEARPPKAPARLDGIVEQTKQGLFGGRSDTARDRTTQPQRSFPSTTMSFTAISFSASPRR